MQLLAAIDSPSLLSTIGCHVTDEKFNGAHNYEIRPMVCFQNGEGYYGGARQLITFVKRNEDGTWQPGILSEQLLHLLKDRHEKLNAIFPSDDHAQFIAGLDLALDALERRVRERTERGVMGTQQK